MYIHKSYPIPLYGSKRCRVHVIISDSRNWNKMITTLNLFSDDEEPEPYKYKDVSAFFTQTELKGIGNFWIVFKNTKSSLNINTMSHEAAHATNAILNSRGIKPSFSNDEAQAYLSGWVSEVAYKTIKKYLK